MNYYAKYFQLKMRLLDLSDCSKPNWDYWWKHWLKLDQLITDSDKRNG